MIYVCRHTLCLHCGELSIKGESRNKECASRVMRVAQVLAMRGGGGGQIQDIC